MAVTTTYTFGSTRTEFIANSNGTGNSQFLSNVTALSGGGFALTYGTENGSNDVPYVSIYNSATGAESPLFLPYDVSGTDMQGEPVITQLENGNVVVVWKEGAGGSNAIVQTVFDPLTGNAIGPREVIVSGVAGNTDVEITALSNGNWVATWSDPALGVQCQIYDSTGAAVGPLRNVFASGTGDPAVVATADGGFSIVAVYADNIYSNTRDAAGTHLSDAIHVTGGTNSAPQVAALKGGGFALVYDDADFGGQPGIGLKLSTAAPDVVIRVDTYNTASGDRDPEITVLENGFIVVTWTHEFSGTDDDIYGHIFDANGTSISVSGNDLGGGVFVIDSSLLDQNQSSLAALLNGMFVTTWTNAQGDGSGDGISGDVRELTRTITGDGAVDFIIGDELRDTIFGGGGGDHLAGGKGNDILHGDAGDDVLVVKASDSADGAETLDGGLDRDSLELDLGNGGDFTFDLRNDTITSIEEIDVNGDFGNTSVATVVLNANQFGAGVSTDAVFARIGDVAPALTVFMEGQTSLDLSGLTFSAPFTVTINGDSDAETIIGTTQNDTINGGGGIDTLTGGLGVDNLYGGAGNDLMTYVTGQGYDNYYGDADVDTVVFQSFFGDALQVDLELGLYTAGGPAYDIVDVENLVTGDGDDNIIGSSAANAINSGDGADTITGGGGADSLSGGAGDDAVIVRQGDDAFGTETYDGGGDTDELNVLGGGAFDLRNDTILSFERLGFASGTTDVLLNASLFGLAGISLASDIFNASATTHLKIDMGAVLNFNLSGLTLNPANPQSLTITITGDGDSETITGSTLSDTINGGGGIDSLTGGLGNDRYFVDSADDIVTEDAGAGTGLDTIFSSASYTIAANVERLQLTGSGNINATGRDGAADTLIGNSGNNTLDGKTGNDMMRGLLGNDIYIVSSAGDVVDEVTGGGGADTIRASVSYTISAGVERLELTGSGNINATGRDGTADTLIGNSGNNALDGRSGNDTMRGLLGNDIYVVANAGDVVDEVTGGGGADTIQASVSYTISAGVETLQLTGTATINATGRDAQADTLIGNSGNNVLNGMSGGDSLRGGLGNDTLTGGIGNDLFRFDTALNAVTNRDTITDFNVVNDTIQLENAIFAQLLTTGVLAANLFKDIGNVGAVLDGDDRIVYDHNTGFLSYDADGSGAGLATQFATLTNHALLLNTDFVVI